jgi:uncharacterized membrane protein YfcA
MEQTVAAAAYVILVAGAIAAGFVSGLAGFGTALMALGIWLYVLPPSLAVPLVLICSIVGQTSTLPSMWRSRRSAGSQLRRRRPRPIVFVRRGPGLEQRQCALACRV